MINQNLTIHSIKVICPLPQINHLHNKLCKKKKKISHTKENEMVAMILFKQFVKFDHLKKTVEHKKKCDSLINLSNYIMRKSKRREKKQLHIK